MGIFGNLFGDKSTAPNFNIDNVKFDSSDHIRYENNKDVSGHNLNCNRCFTIEKQNNSVYIVTMYNLNGLHPFWRDNLQMAPKQMKIVKQDINSIELRGFGVDSMGGKFEDYGIVIHHNTNQINQIDLLLHDRNIKIEYYI